MVKLRNIINTFDFKNMATSIDLKQYLSDNKSKSISLRFFSGRNLPGEIERKLYKGKPSSSSYEFVHNGKDSICDVLIANFGINNPARQKLFRKKYKEAIGGDGHEWKRICTLHSSSLLALLFFYSISEENMLTININGIDYIFDKSKFEVKTAVSAGHYSNMDVVLESSRDKVKLYLECKFTEYLSSGKVSNISEIYFDKYEELGLYNANSINHLVFSHINKVTTISQDAQSKGYYCQGIKQMLSHYIGITIQQSESYKIFLGEILFEFCHEKEKMQKYEQIYESLANKLNHINSNVEMLKQNLTYQKISHDFIQRLEPKIRDFYQLD